MEICMLFFTAIVPPVSYGLFALLYNLLLQPHGQHGKPFVVYDPSGRQELLVPVQHIKWLCSQLDSKLSNHAIHQERHAAKYLKKGIELSTSRHFLGRLIRDRLNRHLHELQPLMHDELRLRIDELYGRDEEEWKEIDLYRSFEGVVTATITRVLLGLPLSRDPRISSAFQRYTLFLGLGVLYVGQLPRIFKRVVAGVINLPLGYYRNKALAALIPVVEQQVALGMDKENDVDKAHFVWHAAKISEKSIVDGLGTTCKPEVIAEWVMLLGMAGTHTTTIQATNMLLNVANCPEEWQVVELLREEAQGTLANDADWANASSFKQHGLAREVIPSSGLELPDGTSMPKGGWVGVPILGIHRDEKYYTNADVFEPFRFVKERSTEKAPGSTPHEGQLDAAKPTTTYLTFGYGRHSCPGRWFAVLMLKMITAYIVLNYDIESTGPIPPTRVIGDSTLPRRSATIRVRRRKQTTK
ncbi:hypothetical protein ANO14919_069220 [Xylariales sp. No.14919]|nr:hypothetical protein ANO14919_069220 [Xylariales sp. No.14919]